MDGGTAPLDAVALRKVSEAVGASLTNGNEGWTLLGHESDGTRVRVRVRMISQRLIGDAGA